MAAVEWKSVLVSGPDDAGIATLTLNRPTKFNALDNSLFAEIPVAVRGLDSNPSVRVVVVNAAGAHFCSGIDLSLFEKELGGLDAPLCLGRQKEKFRRDVKVMQEAFNSFEECRKPVIAAIHGACIGGGIDMVTACDLRYCTEDAVFSVKEVDVAITADLGTLQRLPKLVGHGTAMELALTGRKFSGTEAKQLGLVQGVVSSMVELQALVHNVASQIAAKSPLAVTGTKTVLLKSRDLTVAQGLEFVGLWNAAMLDSADLKEAMQARAEKVNIPVSICEEKDASGGVEHGLKRQIFDVGESGFNKQQEEEAEDHHVQVREEAPKAALKRKAGRPRKKLRLKMEESEAGRNWPDSEVFALIDVRGKMEPDFVKNAKKQGIDSWSNLHSKMVASVQGFHRTPVACKRKFNSLYKLYKEDKVANNISEIERHESRFYPCLDNWWHGHGRGGGHGSGSGSGSGHGNGVGNGSAGKHVSLGPQSHE